MFTLRYAVWYATIALCLLSVLLTTLSPHFLWILLVSGPLALLRVWDVLQNHHAVLRNYPVSDDYLHDAEEISCD